MNGKYHLDPILVSKLIKTIAGHHHKLSSNCQEPRIEQGLVGKHSMQCSIRKQLQTLETTAAREEEERASASSSSHSKHMFIS